MNSAHARRVLDFQQIRTVPLAAILERLNVLGDLRRRGSSQLVGCCPIHKGTNKKQFVCDLNKGLWHCFGDCQKGGDALALVSEIENVDVRAAAELIATWFALGTPAHDYHRKPKERAMSGNRPTHKAFAVRDGDPNDKDSKAWYTRIGSAWPHKSGKGMTIQLDALPVGDRIVLFEYEEDDAKEDEAKAAKFAKKK